MGSLTLLASMLGPRSECPQRKGGAPPVKVLYANGDGLYVHSVCHRFGMFVPDIRDQSQCALDCWHILSHHIRTDPPPPPIYFIFQYLSLSETCAYIIHILKAKSRRNTFLIENTIVNEYLRQYSHTCIFQSIPNPYTNDRDTVSRTLIHHNHIYPSITTRVPADTFSFYRVTKIQM